jgi:pimeloyl-ACP methyl ester carboxylesterase
MRPPLAFRVWGHTRPRVLFIHGLADGGFAWNAIARALTSCSSIAVDLRGHGDSSRDPERSYLIADHAADVLQLIEAHRLTDLIVAGHSLGAAVAALVTVRAPECVRGLIIVDGGPEADVRAAGRTLEQLRALPKQFTTVGELERILLARHPFAEPAVLREYAHCALRYTPGRYFELKFDPDILHAPDLLATASSWAALGSRRFPKLLVRGAASAILTQARAIALSSGLPDCRLLTIPRAGHAVPIDNPAELREAITAFVAEVAS